MCLTSPWYIYNYICTDICTDIGTYVRSDFSSAYPPTTRARDHHYRYAPVRVAELSPACGKPR